MLRRAQGTFEYVLLLGGALLIVSLATLVLINQSPDVDERKVCAASARAAVSCFDAQGNFYKNRTFLFNGRQTSCGCAPGDIVPGNLQPPGSSATPVASPAPGSCTVQSQSCNPSSSTCCAGLTCTGGLPFIGGDTCQVPPGQPTPSPTPQACQNTPTSCGQPGVCQDCTQQQAPATQNGEPFCQQNQVVHTQTTFAASCQTDQTCGFTPTQTTVVDQTCSQTQVCQNAACVPIQDVALIVGDDVQLERFEGLQFAPIGTNRPLNAEELSAKALIESEPTLKVTYVKASQATYDALKAFTFVAAVDYYASSSFNTEVFGKLLADGKGIWLVHDAIGFTQNQQPGAGNPFMRVKKPGGFISNYSEYREYDSYIPIQSGGQAYNTWGMTDNWGAAQGYGYCCGGEVSAATTTHASGGRAATFGYDVSKLTEEGRIPAESAMRWAFGKPAAPYPIVPKDAVALIAKDYAATPTLTEKEQALKQLWEKEGYTVFVVPQSKRFEADYSKAKAITAAEDVNVQLPDFLSRLSDEKPVLLASNGLRVFWPLTESDQNRVSFSTNNGFLSKYDPESENWVDVTSGGKGYTRNNWGYGFEQTDSTYGYSGATFHKKPTKAYSALIGFDPSKLTGEGRILFQEAIRYVTQEYKKTAVPQGAIVLVAESYDDVPTLSTTESALKAFLEERGHLVHAISQARRFTTDYANAKAVVIAGKQPYEFTLRGFYLKLSDEKPLLVVHNGVRLMHRLGNGGNIAYTKIQRDSQKAFLAKYDPNEEVGIPITTAGTSFTKRGWDGWNQLDWTDCCYGGALAYREAGSVKSALFAYDVAFLSAEGKIMLDEILRWMFSNASNAQTVPESQVGLLVADYDGSVLTAEETALKTHLMEMGLNVAIVPQKNRFKADFSKAAFLAMAEKPYPQTLSGFFAGLQRERPRMLLVGEGTQIPKKTGVNQAAAIHVTYNEGPLARYTTGKWIGLRDTAGPAYGAGIWRGIGQVSTCCGGSEIAYSHQNALGQPDNACGVLFGFTPNGLNPTGKLMLDNTVRWLYNGCYLGKTGSSTSLRQTVPAECAKESEFGNVQCTATANFEVPRSVNFYDVQLQEYFLDDYGTVHVNAVQNANKILEKNSCCYNTAPQCSSEATGLECKGGCNWNGADWTCGLKDGSRVCTRPTTHSVMDLVQAGSNTFTVTARDGFNGQPETLGCYADPKIGDGIGVRGKAVIHVYDYN